MNQSMPAPRYPVLPLKNSVLFPEMMMPLVVGRPASIAAVDEASSSEDKTLVVVSQKDLTVEEPALDDLFPVGTLAVIKRLERGPAGVQLIVQGHERVRLLPTEQAEDQPFLTVQVEPLPMPEDEGTEVEALHRAIVDQAKKILGMIEPRAQAGLSELFSQITDPLKQVYLLGSLLPIDLQKEQALLAANTRAQALRLMVDYITHETQVLELRQKITSQAQSEMTREQREYLLRQQLRAIQEELGEGGGRIGGGGAARAAR